MTLLSPSSRAARRALLAALCAPLLAFAQPASAPAETDKKDYSAAERLLFMSPHLANVKPPATLNYRLRRTGPLEPAFEDRIALKLTAQPDGSCCAAHTEFLSAERNLDLPDVPAAEGNPVLLFFLEREVREMKRLTKGSQNHFRQRLRMAAYQGATVRAVKASYRGKPVEVQEVSFSPYLDDPNRPRFEKFAGKTYRFWLASAVPGGLLGLRTQVPGADGAPVQMTEELLLDGAEAPAN